MDDKTQLTVDQFSFVSGNWQPQPANLRVIDASNEHQASRLRRGRGSLLIVIEVSPAEHLTAAALANLCQGLMTTLEETYYQISGSVTRGLREALLAANKLLFEQNLRADSEHRTIIGINCAVLRDSEVYLAQLGPSLATLLHQGRLSRYPEDSAWLRGADSSTVDLTREPAAGLRRDSEPNLSHLSLVPGDTLVLSTTALASLASAEELLSVATNTTEATRRAALAALAAGEDLSAIVVSAPATQQGSAPQALPRAAPAPLAREQPAPRQAPAPDSVEPMPRPPADEPSSNPFVSPRRAAPLVSGRSSAPVIPDPWAEADDAEDLAELTEDTEPAEPLTLPLRRSTARPAAPRSDVRQSLAERARQVRRGTQGFLLRVLPANVPAPPPRQAPPPTISLGGRALVLVAMAIPLAMVFLVVMTRIQYDRTRQSQFDELLVSAQQHYDAANKADTAVNARQAFGEALAVIEEGLAVNPAHEGLNDLRRQVQHKLDQLNVVTRLFHFWQLLQLEDDPVSAIDSSRLVIQGINVFVFNRGSSRVYKYLLNDVGDAVQPVEGSPILAQKGELHGEAKLGDMVDIAWLAASPDIGGRKLSTFVILERNGTLLAYDPQQGLDALPVADSDKWLKPQAIGGYQGNLYVLDPLLGRILKYKPTDNAYTTPPASYLVPEVDVDLTSAVDFTIDGNIYVLFADGKIAKFYDGYQQPFSMSGLPTPMRSPTSIFVGGDPRPDAKGYIYVADTGNERILQFDKAGTFVRQFQAQTGESQFKNLRGLYVDEQRGRMFILSGRTLWLTDIPPLGQENP
jgi:hypothetical protein